MVEEDTYCIDVLTQVSAATKALQASRWACSTSTSRTAWQRRRRRAGTRAPPSSRRRPTPSPASSAPDPTPEQEPP
jgi:hypothetical protein